MNIGIFITENQIRNLIREELETVLLEEGVLSKRTLTNAIGISLLLAALKPTEVAIAELPKLNLAAQEIQNTFNELGIKNFNALANDPLDKNQKQAVKSVYEKVTKYKEALEIIKINKETLNQQYQQTDDENEIEKIKQQFQQQLKTEERINGNITTVIGLLDPIAEQLIQQGDLAGIIMRDTFENNNDLASIDTNKIATEYLQKVARGDKEYQSKIIDSINSNINDDLQKFAGSVVKAATGKSQQLSNDDAFKISAAYADLNDLGLPKNPTTIDVVYTLSNNTSKLMGKFDNFKTPKLYNKEGSLITQLNTSFKENPDGYLDNNELADVDKNVIDRYQTGLYTAEEVPKEQVKESKVNKLRQRLNELRGVYV
jgi:hypothetical protein